MQRKPTRRKDRNRDLAYLKWVKSQPCSVTGCIAIFVDAHHAGPHGLGQKADDRSAIPLCVAHHQHGPEAVHVLGKRFWIHHNLDLFELIAKLNAQYEEERSVAA